MHAEELVRRVIVLVGGGEREEHGAEAEVALAVAHSAQAHGVGTLLLEYLVPIARAHGVRRFVAEVLTENRRMMRLLTDSGLPCHLNREGPVTHVELVLDEVEPYLNAMSERERLADKASLRVLLRPQSVAVIGAGRSEGSVGHAVLAPVPAPGTPRRFPQLER